MIETCVLEAEDCGTYLSNNHIFDKSQNVSHNDLILKYHMKVHQLHDPLPLSLLQLFLKDNFKDNFDFSSYELIWTNTEFYFVDDEWVWQKNLIVEFYWKEEHFKLEFFLNLDYKPNYKWYVVNSYDYEKATRLLGNILENFTLAEEVIKSQDRRSAKFLSKYISWELNEEITHEDFKECIERLLQIRDEYTHSPENFIDITQMDKDGNLIYEDDAVPTNMPMSEFKRFYIDEDKHYTKETFVIPDITLVLDLYLGKGIFFLLDEKKIVKSLH